MIRVIVYLLCANRDSASSWGISIVKVHLLDTNKGEMIRVIVYLLCANRDSASSGGLSIVKVHLLDMTKGEMSYYNEELEGQRKPVHTDCQGSEL